MHRQPLLDALDRYARRWPDEAATAARLAAFVREHDDCFERTQLTGHVTGSAWVVDRSGERVLLTHHRKLDIWVQLGGHADGVADTVAVARAEAEEESGLAGLELVSPAIFDIDIHSIPARRTEPEHLHHDVRHVFRATGDEVFVVSEESHDLAWVPIAELGDVTREESMLRMARKWLAGWP